MRKLNILLISLVTLITLSVVAIAEQNLVINGDFSDDLVGWTFKDNSQNWFGYNEVTVEDGRARIHSHKVGNGGQGTLTQDLPKYIVPTYFKIDYEEYAGHTCGSIFMGLVKDGEIFTDAIYRYHVGGQDIAPNYARSIFLDNTYEHATNDKSYENGTLEIYFDYDTMKANIYINGKYETSFDIPSTENVTINKVVIGAINNCWDGRNDYIGYFDNIVLIGAVLQATIDIDPDTLNLNSSGEWVTAYIELPTGYNVSDINVSTIKLEKPPITSTIIYNYGEYESSLDTYVQWSSDIRTRYPRTGDPIGEGREGYYWLAPPDYVKVGWCSELLCNDIYLNGFEIFNFPLSIDPTTIDSAIIKIQTYTPTDKSWWQQIGFDVYINDVKVGSGVSAARGEEKISEIIIDDPSVLKEGLNNIFVVYNGPQSGYGQQSLSRWTQLDYIIVYSISAELRPSDIGDHDEDGIPDYMVKFDRSDVHALLSPADEVELTVTGELTDGTPFEGSDTIRVI